MSQFAVALVASMTMLGAPAASENPGAELARKGMRAFNLQQFDEAIRLLSAAYRHTGSADLLFGIAQAHRKSDRCEEAVEFYQRYQSVCRDGCRLDERTAELITKSKLACAEKKALSSAPPAGMSPEPPKGPAATKSPATDTELKSNTGVRGPEKPSRWAARFEGAAASLRIGDLTALQGSFRGALGYEFGDGALRFGPAIGVELIPAAYEYIEPGTLLMTEVSARGVGTWLVGQRVRIRSEAGVGMLIVGGQVARQPVRTDRSDSTSTLLTFVGAAGVDVHVVGPVGATATVQLRGTPSSGPWDDGLFAVTFGGGLVLRW